MTINLLLVNMMVVSGRGYYNQIDQQFIAHTPNCGLEQVSTELVPNNVLEEKEDWFYQWADNYDVWDNNPYTPTKGNEIGSSHKFNVDTSNFNLTKTKHNKKSKTRIMSEVSASNNKSDFCIGKGQS